ncbi:MAG: glycosyltransferase family 2 protein [Solirubrobacterales bacterium]|nr:glycosyltransferase family 2 protein [Solirubrobacterales bacterium]
MAAPKLEVVIVSYRCRDHVLACLDSLERHPLRGGEMVVHLVDNASGDGTVEEVRRRFPAVEVVALDRNAGFSVANNVVLARARAEYVLALNPDTEATEGALDHMVALMDANPDVGMAGCRLVQPDGTFDHAAKRSFPTPLSALAHFAGIGRRSDSRALGGYRAPDLGERERGEVDAVNGAFMLVRRDALADVGLLDEAYWLYMEDLDWCYRFHQAGWKVLYDGGATFVHVKGGAAGTWRAPRQNVAFHRGMGRFYRKFHGAERPLGAWVVYAGIGAKLAVSLTRSAVGRRQLAWRASAR